MRNDETIKKKQGDKMINRVKSLVEEYINWNLDEGGSDFYIDEDYSIQSQMTDHIIGLCDDIDIEIERGTINELLDDFEDELFSLELKIRLIESMSEWEQNN